jgi:transposase-like protein
MGKTGRKNQIYTEEFKKSAVKRYKEGNRSYKMLAKELGLRSSTQLKNWVKKFDNGESFDDLRGRTSNNTESNPFKGRPRTNFKNIEEERDYYKAQVEYLKKQYPNLHGEGSFQKQNDLKS